MEFLGGAGSSNFKSQQWGRELLILALKWMQKMKIRSQFLEIPWGSWLLQSSHWGSELIIWALKWMQKIEKWGQLLKNTWGSWPHPVIRKKEKEEELLRTSLKNNTKFRFKITPLVCTRP